MKFNTDRTVTRSPLSGVASYLTAIAAGQLRSVQVRVTQTDAPGWRRTSACDLHRSARKDAEPLEVSGFVVRPRALVIDELTRHRSTAQAFVPLDGPLVVALASPRIDSDDPDPDLTSAVAIEPGEFVDVLPGTWHTLPFAFTHPTRVLSIMNRDSLDGYHDVRDLPAAGWVGWVTWDDEDR